MRYQTKILIKPFLLSPDKPKNHQLSTKRLPSANEYNKKLCSSQVMCSPALQDLINRIVQICIYLRVASLSFLEWGSMNWPTKITLVGNLRWDGRGIHVPYIHHGYPNRKGVVDGTWDDVGRLHCVGRKLVCGWYHGWHHNVAAKLRWIDVVRRNKLYCSIIA